MFLVKVAIEMRFEVVKRFLLPSLLLFSLACGCFTYGLAVGRYKIYPYRVIRDASTALFALIGLAAPDGPNGLSSYRQHVLVPTVIDHAQTGGDELLLVSGGSGYRKDLHADGCVAWLMDRGGQIKHIWKYDPHLWDDLQSVTQLPGVSGAPTPVGLHVFDDGDLLVNYQGVNTFPFAIGMARFDKHSNLRWKRELQTHHWFSVAPDGRIFVPAVRVVDAPIPIGHTSRDIVSESGKIYADLVLVLDQDGNVLQEISLLDALFASGQEGLLLRPDSEVLAADDPLHSNDARLVGDDMANGRPWLSPDDLLISFRNINTIGILDITTQRFKWMASGAMVGQHSPRFYDGGVLVLDNLGGNQETGGTQLVKIDLATHMPTRLFPRDGVATPDDCRIANGGHVDIHRDGKRALLTVSHDGAIWEIDLPTGKVLWEYIYVHPHEGGIRQGLQTAKYVYEPSFLRLGDES